SLEKEIGEQLFVQTGGLMIGPPNGELFAGALRSATEHGLAHTILEPAEVHARFPGFRVPTGSMALYEPRAGLYGNTSTTSPSRCRCCMPRQYSTVSRSACALRNTSRSGPDGTRNAANSSGN